MFSYEAKFQQQLDLIGRLRQQVEGLFQIADVRTTELRAMARRILRLATVDEVEQELLAAIGRQSHVRE